MKKKKKKALSRAKKLVLHVGAAEELEQLLGEYVSQDAGDDDAFRPVRLMLEGEKAPKRFVSELKRWADAVGSNLEILQDEVRRANIEDALLTLKSLDSFLGKTVSVTGMKGSRAYVWEVWNW